ncbi:MAG: methylglyoxal synthase [Selenomonadaceae bacterium]
MKTIALIAHDKKKDEMIDFVNNHQDLLGKYHLIATRTTGTLIKENFGLDVETMMSGPLGGDQQIGALIATEQVDFVIFLRDPLTSQPHEPDINALLRICDVHNIPLATNRKSAHIMLKYVSTKHNEAEAAKQ